MSPAKNPPGISIDTRTKGKHSYNKRTPFVVTYRNDVEKNTSTEESSCHYVFLSVRRALDVADQYRCSTGYYGNEAFLHSINPKFLFYKGEQNTFKRMIYLCDAFWGIWNYRYKDMYFHFEMQNMMFLLQASNSFKPFVYPKKSIFESCTARNPCVYMYSEQQKRHHNNKKTSFRLSPGVTSAIKTKPPVHIYLGVVF